IDINARQDVETVSWARHARPDACEFCTMLAGRGAVYRSQKTVGAVFGPTREGSASGGQLEAKFHDWCRCTAAPTFYRIETQSRSTRGFERDTQVLVPIAA